MSEASRPIAGAWVEILVPGPVTTVQDLGRPGLAHLGVGRSGACDEPALRLANRLVGNHEGAAAFELTLGGLTARFTAAAWVALTGAPCPVTSQAREGAPYGPVFVPAGGVLRIGTPARGLRSYLGIRGGLAVEPVLASRSTDLLTGIGPAVVRAGQRLLIGDATCGPLPALDVAPVRELDSLPTLRIRPGPRADWFRPDVLDRLVEATYEVSPDSNRVGVRLSGPAVRRSRTGELPSEGLVVGALQVPPSGQPVLFLADHPVTGGYPVVAVVAGESLPAAAQLRPGDQVRFTSA